MDSPAMSWLSEMGLDSSIFADQCEFIDNTFDDEVAALIQQDFESCLSAGDDNSPPSSTLTDLPTTNSDTSPRSEPPTKLRKPNNYSNFSTVQNPSINPDRANSSTPIILNFGNQKSPEINQDSAVVAEVLRSSKGSSEGPNHDDQSKRVQPAKKTARVRPPSQTYDHIIAERKRREQLSQRFVALSTIVPGLKKMDKTSVLGDAIKYLKHLQERVKTLEEQAKQQPMESVVFVKKSQVMVDDEESSDEKSGSSDDQPLPEIEARICNNQILIRVHCEKEKGILVNLLGQVEKLNLAVANTNVATFGCLTLDITILAEMEKDFNLTMQEVVRRLRAALQPTA